MELSSILLIIVSGAGLLHGLYSAIYLGFIQQKQSISHKILAGILILFGYRVGKSIALYFMKNLEEWFIFSGLATMLFIGPLLLAYVKSLTLPNFKLRRSQLFHLIPFAIALGMSPFFTEEWLRGHRVYWTLTLLFFIYAHFMGYIIASWHWVSQIKQAYPKSDRSNSQSDIIKWLNLVLIGISVIWFSYTLNILDDIIPYIAGPVIYSITIYFLSFKAAQFKALKMDAKAFEKQASRLPIFTQLVDLIEHEQLYLQSDLSLAKLGKLIGLNSHDTSSLINKHSHKNYNEFINHYRIQHAKELLSDKAHEKFTISSIAYDVGFNSLSSFNSAFKKFEGMTPSAFRKQNT
ncbi:MAG: helix-turn-helix domain-containing protein [Flammeovirgaceae bacterium]